MEKELTNYERWQLEKYGNVIKDFEHTSEGDINLFESGIEELNRLAEYIAMQNERELIHIESQF